MNTRKVLVVDDHRGFRSRVRILLERLGYAVVEAADGESGISTAARVRPEVALVDIQLPDVDGFEVAVRIRRAGSARTILLTSTRSRADFGDRIPASGADGFIEKADLSGTSIAAALATIP